MIRDRIGDWTRANQEHSMMHDGMGDWHWGFGFGHGIWGVLLWLLVIVAIVLLLKFMLGGNK